MILDHFISDLRISCTKKIKNICVYLLLITSGGGGPGDLLEDEEVLYPGGGCCTRWWSGRAPGGETWVFMVARCCWRCGAGRGWPPLWFDDEVDWNCSPGITGVLPSWNKKKISI